MRLRCGAVATLLTSVAVALVMGAAGTHDPARPLFDRWSRLAAASAKREVACPRANERTAVLAVAGQSNAGNHGEWHEPSDHGERVLNVFQGRCWVAASPLLGASGQGGAYWDMLASHLIDSGRYERVLIAPFAVAGTHAARWAQGGDLHAPFVDMLVQLNRQHPITHILWHQGEADFLRRTSMAHYKESITSLSLGIRAAGVTAPFYIATASRCTDAPWSSDEPVAQAQRTLARSVPGVLLGADADQTWAEGERFDGCHLSRRGQAAMAQRWFELLTRSDPAAGGRPTTSLLAEPTDTAPRR